MSEKRTETSTGGQDMGPFKAGAPFKFTDVQSLQLAIQAYFGSSDLSMVWVVLRYGRRPSAASIIRSR